MDDHAVSIEKTGIPGNVLQNRRENVPLDVGDGSNVELVGWLRRLVSII